MEGALHYQNVPTSQGSSQRAKSSTYPTNSMYARAQATMLVEQAGRHLASHGEDARLLVELARFIVKRDH